MGDDALTTRHDLGIFRPFIIGYNQAWLAPTPAAYIRGIHDIYSRDMTTNFDSAGVELVMRLVRDSGGSAIRLWAFEGYMEGIRFDPDQVPNMRNQSGRYGPVRGIESDFIFSVDQIMNIAKRYNVKVYWTGFTKWFRESEIREIININERLTNQIYRQRQLALLNSNTYREEFNLHALRSFIETISGYDNLYGFDIFNEVNYGIRDGFWGDDIEQAWDNARRWIRSEVEFIHSINRNLKVTVSLALANNFEENLNHLTDLDLNFYDIHVYNNRGELPDVRQFNLDMPIILGEFGQNPRSAYNDNLKNIITRNFLRNASRFGYSGAFAWRLIDWPRNDDMRQTFYKPEFIQNQMCELVLTPRPAVEIIKNFRG